MEEDKELSVEEMERRRVLASDLEASFTRGD